MRSTPTCTSHVVDDESSIGKRQRALAAIPVFERRSELWCNSTDEGRSLRSREGSADRIASIDDRSWAWARGLPAERRLERLCHVAAGRAGAASAGARDARSHGSGAGVPVLRGPESRTRAIAAGTCEPGCGVARPARQSAQSGQGFAGVDPGGHPRQGQVAPTRHAGRRRLVHRRGRGRPGIAALVARRDAGADRAGTRHSRFDGRTVRARRLWRSHGPRGTSRATARLAGSFIGSGRGLARGCQEKFHFKWRYR